MSDLSRHKFHAPTRRFMVEQDSRASKHVVTLAEVDCDPMAIELGNTVGAAWMKRRLFVLWGLVYFPEHFTARCLIKTNGPADLTHSFEHPCNADPGIFARCNRLLK